VEVSLSSQRKEWPAAVEAQERLTQLRPELAAEQCNLGDLYLRANNLTEAEAPLLTKRSAAGFVCVSVSPGLGELYRATGRTPDAIKELEWVVRFFPEADPKTYLSLALANQAAGKHDAALSALEKGRRLFPANALLQKLILTKN
jgi:lipopolysaccharide biosynthesis regulator YciM